jgi:hypothetical protein
VKVRARDIFDNIGPIQNDGTGTSTGSDGAGKSRGVVEFPLFTNDGYDVASIVITAADASLFRTAAEAAADAVHLSSERATRAEAAAAAAVAADAAEKQRLEAEAVPREAARQVRVCVFLTLSAVFVVILVFLCGLLWRRMLRMLLKSSFFEQTQCRAKLQDRNVFLCFVYFLLFFIPVLYCEFIVFCDVVTADAAEKHYIHAETLPCKAATQVKNCSL